MTAPWSKNVAPWGGYMLFIVARIGMEPGIPCQEARWVHLGAPCDGFQGAMGTQLQLPLGEVSSSTESPSPVADVFSSHPITVEFRHLTTGEALQTYTLSMPQPNAQGQVALLFAPNLAVGTYAVYVRPYWTWLGRGQAITWQPGSQWTLALVNGDVNGDN